MKSILYTALVGAAMPVILAGKALKGTGKGMQVAGKHVENAGTKTEAQGVSLAATNRQKALTCAEQDAKAAEERHLAKLAKKALPAEQVVDAVFRRMARAGAVEVEAEFCPPPCQA